MGPAQLLKDAVGLLLAHWGKALAIFLVVRAIYRRYFHPLRDIPGPWLASITSAWLTYLQYNPKQHWTYVNLHRKYGPVVRVSPNRVLFTSPDMLQEYSGWDKSIYWTAFRSHPTVSNHGTVLEAKPHRIEKAKIMGAFSLTHLLKSESKVDGHVLGLMDQFATLTKKPFDIAPWCQYFAWDVALDVTLSSRQVNFVKNGYDVRGLIGSLHSLLFISSVLALYSWIPRLLNNKLWYPLLSPKPSDTTGIGAIYGLAYNTVKERFDNNESGDSDDVIQWLIDRRDKDGNNLSLERLKQEAFSPVLAGSDTTASTLRSMLLGIACNARIYNKLMGQIEAADAAGLLSTPPSYGEIKQHVPYIDAIRKEALRLVPASAGPFFRQVPPKGATIDGHFIPGGFDVGIVHWSIARDPVYWGDDYDLFRPERWTDETDEHRKKMRDLGDVFFSAGIFMCTGRHLAIMEIMKMPIELLRRFELEVVNLAHPWDEIGSLAVLHKNFFVKLTEREKGEKEKTAS